MEHFNGGRSSKYLSDLEKFRYLMSCLRGEPLNLVKSIPYLKLFACMSKVDGPLRKHADVCCNVLHGFE